MPPTVHSNRIEKPEGMSLTWKPRLVKTPTPTMSATTIAVATSTETVAPLAGSEPGHAALPVSDVAISDRTLSAARLSLHGAGGSRPIQGALTRIYRGNGFWYLDTKNGFRRLQGATASCENGTIATRLRGCLKASGSGEFLRKLNVT